MYENSENNFNNIIEHNDKVNMDQNSPSTSINLNPKAKIEMEMENNNLSKMNCKMIEGIEDLRADQLTDSKELHD